jgi:hypothetical protein
MAESDAPGADRITFHYLKGNHFRVVHMDGAIGSITPNGLVHAAIYSERPAIPQMMAHPIEGGQLGEPVEIVSRPGVVREVEVSLMMDLEVAEAFQRWIGSKIQELKRLQEKRPASE